MSGVGRRRWAVSGSIVTGDWCGCCCCCCCCWRRRCWRCWCGWWQRCSGDHVCRRVLSSQRVSVTVVTGRAIDSHRRHRALTHPSNVKMNSINEQYLTCTVYKETFEDTLVLVGLRRIMTVVFFAPCTNILTYLLTWWTQKVAPPPTNFIDISAMLANFCTKFYTTAKQWDIHSVTKLEYKYIGKWNNMQFRGSTFKVEGGTSEFVMFLFKSGPLPKNTW